VDPSTTLSNIKQITNPQIIKKCLNNSFKRLVYRRLEGDDRLLYPPINRIRARLDFISASELASAFLAFNQACNDKWSDNILGVKKELAMCLHQSADVSLQMKEYDTALAFALGAEKAGKEAEADRLEGLNKDVVAKSKKIIAAARKRVRGS